MFKASFACWGPFSISYSICLVVGAKTEMQEQDEQLQIDVASKSQAECATENDKRTACPTSTVEAHVLRIGLQPDTAAPPSVVN